MATSIVPALIDALFTTATAGLPEVIVLDGDGVTDDPGDYLMVGVQDPDASPPLAASVTQAQQAFGSTKPRQETGTVYLTAYSWNGDGGDAGQKAARDAVYAIAAALENALRPNNLAVTGLLSVGFGEATTFRQGQADFGVGAQLMFSVQFLAQI